MSETESPSEYTLLLAELLPFASVDRDSDSSLAMSRTAPGLAFSCAEHAFDAARRGRRQEHRISSKRKMEDFGTMVFMNMPELQTQILIGTFGRLHEF